MTALAVAVTFWITAGTTPSPCINVRLADLQPPVLGRAQVGGCNVWISRRLLPARTRQQGLRLCWTVTHELGHTLGLKHEDTGIMRRTYRTGRKQEPGVCWAMHLPATCITCTTRTGGGGGGGALP